MKATGEVYAWGRGLAGEIGDGGNADRWSPVPVSMPPVPVPTLSAVQVGAGQHSSFAILG
jgi:alpha-tubulin suppressor-like RCC1 family protein